MQEKDEGKKFAESGARERREKKRRREREKKNGDDRMERKADKKIKRKDKKDRRIDSQKPLHLLFCRRTYIGFTHRLGDMIDETLFAFVDLATVRYRTRKPAIGILVLRHVTQIHACCSGAQSVKCRVGEDIIFFIFLFWIQRFCLSYGIEPPPLVAAPPALSYLHTI